MKRLETVQILRAVAALLVTVYHIRAIEQLAIGDAQPRLAAGVPLDPGLVSGLWANGFAGVDLFFVISGFIMVYVTRQRPPGVATVGQFLFARAARIYPIWWLFASVMVGYFLIAYGAPVDVDQAAASHQAPWLHLVKSYLLVPQPVFPVLGVGWTLVHEMYFYLVFAGFLLCAPRWLPWLLLAWLVLVVGGSLAGLSGTFAVDYLALIFYPMTAEFILGAAVALVVVSGRVWRPGLVAWLGGLGLLLAMQFVPAPESRDAAWTEFMLQWGRVICFGVPGAGLVYGLSGLDLQARPAVLLPITAAILATAIALVGLSALLPPLACSLAAIAFGLACATTTVALMARSGGSGQGVRSGLAAIGDWSYSLYLCHMLVLSGLRRILPWAAPRLESALGLADGQLDWLRLGTPGLGDNILFLVVGLATCLGVAGCAYYLFEKPVTAALGRTRRGLWNRTPSASGAA